MSLCFAVASGKGGVGKSVLAANLAAAFALDGLKTLIVDADIGLRSQDCLLSLENRVMYDLVDLAKEECTSEQAILTSERIPLLSLLPAAQFARAKSLTPKKFRKIISSLRMLYDCIIIDCPAGIERGLRNVLSAGPDRILLVATPDDICIRSAERTAQIIEKKTEVRPDLVVNRIDINLERTGEILSAQSIAGVLDLPLLGTVPEDSVVYRSILKHDLFLLYDCEARSAVLRIASRLRGNHVPFPEAKSKKGFLFRSFFSGPLKEVSPIDDH